MHWQNNARLHTKYKSINAILYVSKLRFLHHIDKKAQRKGDNMKQCIKGHIYDEKRNSECPYCQNNGVSEQSLFPRTASVSDNNSGAAFPKTVPLSAEPERGPSSGMSRTIALDRNEAGIDPVRGWLVAIDGVKMGTSFELHGEQNSIGRGSNFDINLSFDNAVSSDGNAVIAFDSQTGKFYISPVFGKGKNNVHHNSSMLLTPSELNDYDKIKIGAVTYVFRSFCNSGFSY